MTGVQEMRGHSRDASLRLLQGVARLEDGPESQGGAEVEATGGPSAVPPFLIRVYPDGLSGNESCSPLLSSILCCGIQPTSSFPLQRDAELGVLEKLMGPPLRPCSPPLTGREARALMKDASLGPQVAGCVPKCVLSFLPALPVFPAL